MINKDVVKKHLQEGLTEKQIALINLRRRSEIASAVRELGLEHTRKRNRWAFVIVLPLCVAALVFLFLHFFP